MDLPYQRASLDGQTIRYLRAGNGPPLLLVHGIGGSSEWWVPCVDELAGRFTIYAPDLPGSGESDLPRDHDVEQPGTVLARFLDELSISRAAVIGHSMGGFVAAEFAVNQPDRVSALVLMDSAGFGTLHHPLLRMMVVPGLGELMLRAPDPGIDFFIGTLFRWRNLDRIPPWLRECAKRYARRPGFAASFLQFLRSGIDRSGRWIRGPMLTDRLKSTSMPLLILWAADDPLFPAAQAKRAAMELPPAEVRVIDGHVGHVLHISRPAAFFEHTLPFLETSGRVSATVAR